MSADDGDELIELVVFHLVPAGFRRMFPKLNLEDNSGQQNVFVFNTHPNHASNAPTLHYPLARTSRANGRSVLHECTISVKRAA